MGHQAIIILCLCVGFTAAGTSRSNTPTPSASRNYTPQVASLPGGQVCTADAQCASGSCGLGTCCGATYGWQCSNCDTSMPGKCLACLEGTFLVSRFANPARGAPFLHARSLSLSLRLVWQDLGGKCSPNSLDAGYTCSVNADCVYSNTCRPLGLGGSSTVFCCGSAYADGCASCTFYGGCQQCLDGYILIGDTCRPKNLPA